MPPGFFLFTAIHRGRSREPGGILMSARHDLRIPKNPVYEAGESTGRITTEYSMRYPDLLS